MKFRTLSFLILVVAFTQLNNIQASAQMVDSSEYVSIVKEIQQRGHINEGSVRINQSSSINQMLDRNAFSNQQNQSMQGYRIRIYRDNNQYARQRSEQIVNKFKERYPDVGVYRSYEAPYFKVTIGDFRTPDDAIKFQTQIAADYGSEYANTYLVSEKIYFPPVNNYE